MQTPLTILIHGEAGVGKTRLVGTLPPPVCVLDLEGRSRYLPGRKVVWDVLNEDPPPAPTEENPWTHCIAPTTQFTAMERAYQWAQSGRHPFKSFAVDSLTFAQKRFIAHLTGTSQLQESHWGEVLRVLEGSVRDFCDLTIKPNNPIEAVAFTAGTKSENNRRMPLLQGALKETAAYLFDVVGYLYTEPDAAGGVARKLLVSPTAGIVAKDGTDMMGGPVISNPNLTDLYARLAAGEGNA